MIEDVESAQEALNFDFELLESSNDVTYINSPNVPFLHSFKYPLGLKSDVVIEGTVLENACRFAVDLCQRLVHEKNVVFHFSVQLDLNYVARNTFLKGSWGFEEGQTMGKSPFKKGDKFTIEIFLLTQHFCVSVNGYHFCSYSHRIPPLNIDSLEVYGDVKLDRIELSKKEVYPSILSAHDSSIKSLQVSNPPWRAPLTYKLEDVLKPGCKIEINGRVMLLPYRIEINLQTGSQVYPRPLIGLHLSIRWFGKGEDTIVFNTWDENWQQEIVTPMDLIFCPGKKYKLEIFIEKNNFNVIVNNKSLPLYPIRLSKSSPILNLLNTINIQGETEIFNIQLITQK